MKFTGLIGFATFLSPAFLRIAWFYYTDNRVGTSRIPHPLHTWLERSLLTLAQLR